MWHTVSTRLTSSFGNGVMACFFSFFFFFFPPSPPSKRGRARGEGAGGIGMASSASASYKGERKKERERERASQEKRRPHGGDRTREPQPSTRTQQNPPTRPLSVHLSRARTTRRRRRTRWNGSNKKRWVVFARGPDACVCVVLPRGSHIHTSTCQPASQPAADRRGHLLTNNSHLLVCLFPLPSQKSAGRPHRFLEFFFSCFSCFLFQFVCLRAVSVCAG